ncbi:hydrolase [Oenococcus sicerae]|uniref:dextransucrase n=1 Tax=Oenococcus sicerae TaxID=2203724 RepID=A0ABX5QLA1_9LACO|nr:glycoside hydrolase family 70 protein [Oenococcus sicerae]QAS69512.1 hydrolase [Oenococcus sicerae]
MREKEKIVRKKLYKSGKNFVIASVLSLVGISGFGLSASAESTVANPVAATAAAQTDQAATTDPVKEAAATTADTKTNDSLPNSTTSTDPKPTDTASSDKDLGTSPTASLVSQTTQITANDTSSQLSNQNNTSSQQTGYSAKNIQTINGKTYFIDENGQAKKNFAITVDGKLLYFDKDSGALASTDTYQFQQGLSSENDDYSKHNAAAGVSEDNYTSVDGYLTADSWYRPKDILSDGQDWTTSSANDMRPLLMTWWPDKTTQVNYLNYMKSLGLSDEQNAFTNNDSQDFLNQAAENIQAKVEHKISQAGQTQWLKDIMTAFVKSQSNWNISSESQTTGDDKDHLQGGALLYVNSGLTPDANSDYRLLNRTPTNQTGTPLYKIDPTQGGYDFLLANDVDNSNPVVQAEQLNWMYYLINFGSITNNDQDANFDSIRIDAVDNVDADLLQIAADYFKAAYSVDQNDALSDQHLSILEDWSDNDAEYVKNNGDNQLSMDNKMRLSLKYSLTMPFTDKNGHQQRSGLEPLITNSLVDRSNDSATNGAQPNYSFVRAHDSEVQTVIAEIIKEKIDSSSDGLTPTADQLAAAFQIYDADQLQTNKQFTQYNIPSTYALLLTNKDTVPRVYYGDLFTDDGQYMASKSPYYDAINNLLKSRIKYAAGGQKMAIQYMQGSQDMPNDSYRGVLTSVRFGQEAMTAQDIGSRQTRTEGMAVIQSNNPDLKLAVNDKVVVNMGAAHKNQAYRPTLITTVNGLDSYESDQSVPANDIKYTNALGQLIFNSSDIFGTANPQVSGYLAVWVPVGAADTQDARTQSSEQTTTDGQTLHSNAALDSQVIYEGFSNFQSIPNQTSNYANVKIAENTELFKSWGITNFEFPPQYRSSTDKSFLDSIVQNGYAFTDRYDLGFNTPTKYGTVAQLRDVIKALHATGISAMADWVPDQIYNLTGLQIVAATRVNDSGIYDEDSVIDDSLYAAQIKGGGAYQALYGGAFLDQIKARYPSLFQVKQISTGMPMNPDEKIAEWSAKYFNGSNIQGRGAYYVLKDWASNNYFEVVSANHANAFLPKQLLNESSDTGFISDGQGINYYSTSGYQAKNTFIEDSDGNWYHFDENGYMQIGFQMINNKHYYFLTNGIELQDAYLQDASGKSYYFDQRGQGSCNDYYMDKNKQWRYFDQNGVMAQGLTSVTLAGSKHDQYFGLSDGIPVKGQAVRDANGQLRYFASDSGDMIVNRFQKLSDGSWAYFAADGIALTGLQKIAGQTLYFDQQGRQIKGKEVSDNQGNLHYFDADSGDMLTNRYAELSDGSWAYFAADGIALTGDQTINGQHLYFDDQGRQIKGRSIVDDSGTTHYYDATSGELVAD